MTLRLLALFLVLSAAFGALVVRDASSFGPAIDAALRRADEDDALVLVQFLAADRPLCVRMEDETLASERVQAELAHGFELVRVDASREPELFRRLVGESGVLASVALSSRGEPLAARRGFASAPELATFLAQVREEAPEIRTLLRRADQEHASAADLVALGEAFAPSSLPAFARERFERAMEMRDAETSMRARAALGLAPSSRSSAARTSSCATRSPLRALSPPSRRRRARLASKSSKHASPSSSGAPLPIPTRLRAPTEILRPGETSVSLPYPHLLRSATLSLTTTCGPVLLLAALGAANALAQEPAAAAAPIVLGEGDFRFEWVPGWAKLPEGMSFGNTHGCIVVDSRDRVFVNTDTENAVIIFDADGRFVKSWGKEFQGGAHGMCLRTEDGKEVLYLTHLSRHELVKTTLDGDVLWALGYPEMSGIYQSKDQYKPTSVAIGPNGDIYVADGYGLSWVHQYDKDRKYLRSFGGPGGEAGKMNTPHGIWLDTRGKAPVLVVADRGNHRLQWFDLDGKFLSMLDQDLRSPCHVQQQGQVLVVPDLEGRVTLVDGANHILAHLGDNPDPALRAQNGVPMDKWKDGEFLSPHCAAWDSKGNLYVMDWNSLGRITKLQRIRK